MKCKEYQDQLLNLSLGEDVSDDVIEQMIQHVFECEECLRYFRAMKFFDAQMKHRVEMMNKYVEMIKTQPQDSIHALIIDQFFGKDKKREDDYTGLEFARSMINKIRMVVVAYSKYDIAQIKGLRPEVEEKHITMFDRWVSELESRPKDEPHEEKIVYAFNATWKSDKENFHKFLDNIYQLAA